MEDELQLRQATPDDDRALAKLVVEGFSDKFVPVFRGKLERSVEIMTRWISLEHSIGGVYSLILESNGEPVASVGVRTGHSDDEALSRKLWGTLRDQLGLLPALRAAALLSYPRHNPIKTEAYVERLVVTKSHRQQGLARRLLYEAETMGRDTDKSSVGLHVSGGNLPAIKLYQTEGFEEISRQSSRLTGYSLGIKEWLYLKKGL
ncbi:MAG: GNAT family N-acetyltransferase [Rubrobacter sp.]|nr:GNAT family N-acetyltransferase [Rubrobacter sp.]